MQTPRQLLDSAMADVNAVMTGYRQQFFALEEQIGKLVTENEQLRKELENVSKNPVSVSSQAS